MPACCHSDDDEDPRQAKLKQLHPREHLALFSDPNAGLSDPHAACKKPTPRAAQRRQGNKTLAKQIKKKVKKLIVEGFSRKATMQSIAPRGGKRAKAVGKVGENQKKTSRTNCLCRCAGEAQVGA